MVKPKTLDLDAMLGLDDTPSTQNTRPVKMFGREWTLVCDLNTFALSDLATGEPAAIVRFLIGLVPESEADDFRTAIATASNMDATRLGAILQALVEAATERPTTPPSASGSGQPRTTSPRKSVAATSRTRAGH